MYSALSYKTKQFFFVLIKISLVIGAFYFIYHKVTSNTKLQFFDFLAFLNENNVFSLKNITFLIILSIFNWILEIFKWKKLVASFKEITFFEALKQSLGALTVSLFTPNRIGDYGAKALYFKSGFRKRIVLINFIGNVMQMSITILFGSLGFYFFISKYNIEFNAHRVTLFFVTIGIILILSILGLRHNKLKVKGFSLHKIIDFIKNLSIHLKVIGFLISLLRYIIFSFQFYFLLLIFNVDISYINAMVVITSMYLLASIIPSLFIFDVIIKGSVAVYLFSKIGINEFTILTIVLLMWILNFVLPSIIGSFYVLSFKLPKSDRA